MTLTPAVWDGWQRGDPLPSETHLIVDRTVQSLLAVFYRDGVPVVANAERAISEEER